MMPLFCSFKVIVLLRLSCCLFCGCATMVDYTWRGATSNNPQSRQKRTLVTAIIISLLAICLFIGRIGQHISDKIRKPVYQGHNEWRNERTISVNTLAETPLARCDVHTIRSEDGSNVIQDWIFLEEVNAVNVVVQLGEGGLFVVFEQQKYSIPGNTLTPVGGFIDDGESPLTAAKREVLEELGLGSVSTLEKATNTLLMKGMHPESFTVELVKSVIVKGAHPDEFDVLNDSLTLSTGNVPLMEDDPNWVFLGRYRTSANRGGGFLYSYLLKNAVPLVPNGGTSHFIGSGDDESQKISFVSQEEMWKLVSQGRFQEVKWAATFALSLLHLKDGMPGCCIGKQSSGLCFEENCSS